MNDREAIHRLPWLLNGSLSDEEAAEVRQQLATSDEVRRELREVVSAAEIFTGQVPVSVIVDYVAGEDISPYDPEIVREHLENNPLSHEEWTLAKESWSALAENGEGRDDVSSADVLPFQRPVAPTPAPAVDSQWRRAALAASLAAVVCFVGWMSSLRDTDPTHGYNPTIVEVQPAVDDMVLRGETDPTDPTDPTERTLVVRGTEGALQLSLVTGEIEVGPSGLRTLELFGASGEIVWAPEQRFQQSRWGMYAVALPDRIEGGVYTVQLYREVGGERIAAERYTIELQR